MEKQEYKAVLEAFLTKMYPIGTKYIPVYDLDETTNYLENFHTKVAEHTLKDIGNMYYVGYRFIYYEGRFAPIVNESTILIILGIDNYFTIGRRNITPSKIVTSGYYKYKLAELLKVPDNETLYSYNSGISITTKNDLVSNLGKISESGLAEMIIPDIYDSKGRIVLSKEIFEREYEKDFKYPIGHHCVYAKNKAVVYAHIIHKESGETKYLVCHTNGWTFNRFIEEDGYQIVKKSLFLGSDTKVFYALESDIVELKEPIKEDREKELLVLPENTTYKLGDLVEYENSVARVTGIKIKEDSSIVYQLEVKESNDSVKPFDKKSLYNEFRSNPAFKFLEIHYDFEYLWCDESKLKATIFKPKYSLLSLTNKGLIIGYYFDVTIQNIIYLIGTDEDEAYEIGEFDVFKPIMSTSEIYDKYTHCTQCVSSEIRIKEDLYDFKHKDIVNFKLRTKNGMKYCVGDYIGFYITLSGKKMYLIKSYDKLDQPLLASHTQDTLIAALKNIAVKYTVYNTAGYLDTMYIAFVSEEDISVTIPPKAEFANPLWKAPTVSSLTVTSPKKTKSVEKETGLIIIEVPEI